MQDNDGSLDFLRQVYISATAPTIQSMGKPTSNISSISRYVSGAPDLSSRNELKDHSIIDENSVISFFKDGDKKPVERCISNATQFKGLKYNVAGLVPYYRTVSEVPGYLQKYFDQRKQIFSLYDKGCLLDDEGWYSVTHEAIAQQIAERCRCDTILDAFCGVGGNTIAFAKTCQRVIALDKDPVRLALARHNATIYGVADRIEFILTDYLTFVRSYLTFSCPANRKIDVVFLSPPWGGPSYISGSVDNIPTQVVTSDNALSGETPPAETCPTYSLADLRPIHGADLFQLSRQISGNIAYFLPRNIKLEEISTLLPQEYSGDDTEVKDKELDGLKTEMVEVEEEWMGSRLKALTCYFGGLVIGQEHFF